VPVNVIVQFGSVDDAARWFAASRFAGNMPARSGETSPAKPALEDLATLGAGQTRMAAGRRAAGVPLDALDVEAKQKAIGR
jgi:hypothetical protein